MLHMILTVQAVILLYFDMKVIQEEIIIMVMEEVVVEVDRCGVLVTKLILILEFLYAILVNHLFLVVGNVIPSHRVFNVYLGLIYYQLGYVSVR